MNYAKLAIFVHNNEEHSAAISLLSKRLVAEIGDASLEYCELFPYVYFNGDLISSHTDHKQILIQTGYKVVNFDQIVELNTMDIYDYID